MLAGKQNSRIDYDNLSQYIEGWLYYKATRKYERFWFVLRGNVLHGRELCNAYLFCFKDLNIHVDDNVVGEVEIHINDKVELLKCSGNKQMKCDFTIIINETKFHFRADDEISRERWIYALCDLIGKHQIPSELPNERNQIRTSQNTNKKKENDKKNPFNRSLTVDLPSSARKVNTIDRRPSAPVTSTLPHRLNHSSTLDTIEDMPIVAPPRPVCTYPFMLTPHAQLEDLRWFYPGMKRDEAQEKIAACPVGYYLLRDSESKVGSYTLTFSDVDRIKNHMIIQSSDRQYRFHNSEVDTAFLSPQKAVEFYMIKKHSKTLTPIPYCECAPGPGPVVADKDYILPSEMNTPAPPPPLSPPQPAAPAGYRNRELPPTPEIDRMRNMSVEDREEEYLTMNDPLPAPPPPMKSTSVQSNGDQATDDMNGYLKVAAAVSTLPFDNARRGSEEDDENYLEVRDSYDKVKEAVKVKQNDGESDSSSDPDYFEYQQNALPPRSTSTNSEPLSPISPRLPDVPKDPLPVFRPQRSMKSSSSSDYEKYDSVQLQTYTNQDVIDGVIGEAPPIPPRNSKPDLPPRRAVSYRL